MLTGLYRIVTSLAIILNLGDVVYYRFTLKRTTLAVFEEFGDENPFQFLRFFVDYWGITLLGIGLIILFCIIDGKFPVLSSVHGPYVGLLPHVTDPPRREYLPLHRRWARWLHQ